MLADNAPDALEVTADAPSSDDLLSRFLAVDSSEILRIRHEDDARQGKLYRRARTMARLDQQPFSWPAPSSHNGMLVTPVGADAALLKRALTLWHVGASPAGHRPEEGQCSTGCSSFKEDVFYSMCWQTRAFPDLVVVMTFSHSDCERLEWWTDKSEASGRILMVSPAWFREYRPRRWRPSNALTLQADANDTMVAVFIPATRIAGICWTGGKMDLAASIANKLE